MTCEGCGAKFTDSQGHYLAKGCPYCGFRSQPNPIKDEMEMRNMSAPGENDMGGNPLKEGILADGGWQNRLKRDESFASVHHAQPKDYHDPNREFPHKFKRKAPGGRGEMAPYFRQLTPEDREKALLRDQEGNIVKRPAVEPSGKDDPSAGMPVYNQDLYPAWWQHAQKDLAKEQEGQITKEYDPTTVAEPSPGESGPTQPFHVNNEEEWGRGLIDTNGKVHIWGEASGSHQEYIARRGIQALEGSFFMIRPDGTIELFQPEKFEEDWWTQILKERPDLARPVEEAEPVGWGGLNTFGSWNERMRVDICL